MKMHTHRCVGTAEQPRNLSDGEILQIVKNDTLRLTWRQRTHRLPEQLRIIRQIRRDLAGATNTTQHPNLDSRDASRSTETD